MRKPCGLAPGDAFKASPLACSSSEEIGRVSLGRLPAIEWVAVMDHQELDLVGIEARGEPHRRRKAAQERGRRRGRGVMELEKPLASGHVQQPAGLRAATGTER